MDRLQGKRVLITGGSSGIGAACARLFAAEGAASIVIGDLDAERGPRIIDELRAGGTDASFVPTDVAQVEASRALVQAAIAKAGGIDVLVAAAGISYAAYRSGAERADGYSAGRSRALIVDVDPADWRRVMDVNLNGLMYVLQACAAHMISAGIRGSIVTVTSMNARRASVCTSAYSVSKAGAWMLTKLLALETAQHGIRVNAVAPGFIDTPMNTGLKGDLAALRRATENTPLGRLGTATEVAAAALFLASDEASYVTGEAIHTDGGFIAATR